MYNSLLKEPTLATNKARGLLAVKCSEDGPPAQASDVAGDDEVGVFKVQHHASSIYRQQGNDSHSNDWANSIEHTYTNQSRSLAEVVGAEKRTQILWKTDYTSTVDY